MDKQQLEEAIKTAYSNRETNQVKTLAEEAVSTYPKEAFGYAYLAKAALLERPIAFDSAELNWTKVSEIEPNDTSYLRQFAEVKTKMGKHNDAQLLWAKIIELEPNNLVALINRGDYLLKNEISYTKAVDIFDLATHYHPEYTQGYLYRATAYFALEENEKAWKDYQDFVKHNDQEENLGELHLKTNILTKLDKKEELIDTYKQLSDLAPDNGSFPLLVAELSAELGHYQDSAEYYKKAIPLLDKTTTQYSSATFSWGDILYKIKRYEEAVEAYELNAQCSEHPYYSHLKQIDIYLEIGEMDKALEKIDIVRGYNTDVYERNKLNKMKADILLKLRRYHEATEVLYLLLEVDNMYRNEAAFLLGRVLFMAKEMPHAYHYLRLASISGEERATEFLNNNFKDYIFSLQSDFYKSHQSTAKTNAKSAFLKKISGKIWRFERLRDINSDEEAEIELMEELANKMTEVVILYLTEVGFLLGIPESVDFYAYSIKESNAKQMVIDTQSIDGLLSGETTIKLTDDGLLDYCITGNEQKAMILKEITAEEINEPIKTRLQEATESRSIELLGGNAKALTRVVWS